MGKSGRAARRLASVSARMRECWLLMRRETDADRVRELGREYVRLLSRALRLMRAALPSAA